MKCSVTKVFQPAKVHTEVSLNSISVLFWIQQSNVSSRWFGFQQPEKVLFRHIRNPNSKVEGPRPYLDKSLISIRKVNPSADIPLLQGWKKYLDGNFYFVEIKFPRLVLMLQVNSTFFHFFHFSSRRTSKAFDNKPIGLNGTGKRKFRQHL